jgi:uncharacterized protein (DUF697 family)
MAKERDKGRISRVFSKAARAGFQRAYDQVRVDEQKYLRQIKRTHRLPISSWSEMFLLGPEIVDPIARRTIKASARMAGLEGMGLGIGGFLTFVPDMGILATITLRMLQKLSLLYGFEYTTEDENVELWMATASAAGVDLGRDFLGKQAMEKVVPRIIDRVAVKVGSEAAEKWAGMIVPVLGAGVAGGINYYFVRSWGRRAQKHFRERHLAAATRPGASRVIPPAQARLLTSGSGI